MLEPIAAAWQIGILETSSLCFHGVLVVNQTMVSRSVATKKPRCARRLGNLGSWSTLKHW